MSSDIIDDYLLVEFTKMKSKKTVVVDIINKYWIKERESETCSFYYPKTKTTYRTKFETFEVPSPIKPTGELPRSATVTRAGTQSQRKSDTQAQQDDEENVPAGWLLINDGKILTCKYFIN